MSALIEVAKAYRCPHCRKLYERPHAATKHETHCADNADRTPREGEIAHSGQWQSNSDDAPAWHPGKPGLIWFRGAWVGVPGYDATADTWPDVLYPGGFGASWDYPGDSDVEVPLDRVSKTERVRWMEEQA